jgi:GH15 family glucan-1,4-alpha-glucosidase
MAGETALQTARLPGELYGRFPFDRQKGDIWPLLTEETLDHLDGYRGSRPVRIGNGAYDQLQLDIYGELMDAAYIYNKHGSPIGYDLWLSLRSFVDWVCDNWRLDDEGVWEVRGGQRAFVYSKLMCWVAVDRGLRLAEKRSLPADVTRWLEVRNEIYEDIMAKGWSERRQAFIQAYGSESLDAANLMMPLVFFVAPTDPRMLKNARRDLEIARAGRSGRQQLGPSLQRRRVAGRPERRGGHVQHLHLLAGRGLDPGGPVRSRASPGCPADV